MGREVERVALEAGHEIVVSFTTQDPISHQELDGTDVVIDFSHAAAVERLIDAVTRSKVNLVSGTTGWEPDEYRTTIEKSGIGFVHAPNFSPGANILFAAAREAARLAARFDGFSTGIHERHHDRKKDSPSGTALRLAAVVREGSDGRLEPQIAASRVGHEPGLHTLILDAPDDLLELTHRARGRAGFATGAVRAAELVAGRHGFFTFTELLHGSR